MPNPDQHTDHRAEALKYLKAVSGSASTLDDLLAIAQAHASLAIAQGQERVAEEIKAFRELMGRSYT